MLFLVPRFSSDTTGEAAELNAGDSEASQPNQGANGGDGHMVHSRTSIQADDTDSTPSRRSIRGNSSIGNDASGKQGHVVTILRERTGSYSPGDRQGSK